MRGTAWLSRSSGSRPPSSQVDLIPIIRLQFWNKVGGSSLNRVQKPLFTKVVTMGSFGPWGSTASIFSDDSFDSTLITILSMIRRGPSSIDSIVPPAGRRPLP